MKQTPVLFIVAWDWKGSAPMDFNWGPAGASCSRKYRELLTSQVHALAQKRSIRFVEQVRLVTSSKDLVSLERKLQGKQLPPGSVGLYFLWPTQFKDGPNLTPESCPGGYVEEAALFKLMHTAEQNGARTEFPHKARLYRQLVSKSWQGRLCAIPGYNIAPTVVVTREAVMNDPGRTIAEALTRLKQLPAREPDFKADMIVCKLGFSWEALDVRACPADNQSARTTVEALLGQVDCYTSEVIVQKHVAAVFELRCFVIRGKVEYHYCARYSSCEEDTGYFADWESHPRALVVSNWLDGDDAAYRDMLAKAGVVISKWNEWLRCENERQVPAIRIDFLVCYDRTAPGSANLYTLELTELGFSMWNWDKGHEVVFEAVAESCLEQ